MHSTMSTWSVLGLESRYCFRKSRCRIGSSKRARCPFFQSKVSNSCPQTRDNSGSKVNGTFKRFSATALQITTSNTVDATHVHKKFQVASFRKFVFRKDGTESKSYSTLDPIHLSSLSFWFQINSIFFFTDSVLCRTLNRGI